MAEGRVMLEDEAGDVLKKARFGLGLGLAEVAARSGIPEGALAAIESLERPPRPEEVAQLAPVLGLRLEALTELARTPVVVPPPLPPGWIVLEEPRWRVHAYLYLGEVRLLVDAGVPRERIEAYTDRLDAIFLTHEHHDHIDALASLRQLGQPTIFGHEELSLFLRGVVPLADGAGAYGLTALATPGHTALSLSYVGYGAVATGDALFARSMGRPETPEAYRTSLQSLGRILALPEETVVLPGHGPVSTVGLERRLQPFPYREGL